MGQIKPDPYHPHWIKYKNMSMYYPDKCFKTAWVIEDLYGTYFVVVREGDTWSVYGFDDPSDFTSSHLVMGGLLKHKDAISMAETLLAVEYGRKL